MLKYIEIRGKNLDLTGNYVYSMYKKTGMD